MVYEQLFVWWIATITWSILFPIAVSVSLYRRRKRSAQPAPRGRFQWVRDFTFVWFLLGLLIFYIVAVGRGSPLFFGLGNIVVEGLLLLYVFRASRSSGSA